MYKTTLKIDGMMCGMCESHINDTIRKAAAVKKVSSSHVKGEAVVITEELLDVDAVKAANRPAPMPAGRFVCQKSRPMDLCPWGGCAVVRTLRHFERPVRRAGCLWPSGSGRRPCRGNGT